MARISRSRYAAPKRSASPRPMAAPPAPNWRESVMTGIEVVGSRARRSGRGELVDQLAHGGGGAVERGLLGLGQLDLDDLFDALPAQLDRHAHEEALGAVLALQQRGAGEHGLRVAEDGAGPPGPRGGRGGGGRSGPQERQPPLPPRARAG